jgi:hypothetical protein
MATVIGMRQQVSASPVIVTVGREFCSLVGHDRRQIR